MGVEVYSKSKYIKVRKSSFIIKETNDPSNERTGGACLHIWPDERRISPEFSQLQSKGKISGP